MVWDETKFGRLNQMKFIGMAIVMAAAMVEQTNGETAKQFSCA